jgi:hypothetical protein
VIHRWLAPDHRYFKRGCPTCSPISHPAIPSQVFLVTPLQPADPRDRPAHAAAIGDQPDPRSRTTSARCHCLPEGESRTHHNLSLAL